MTTPPPARESRGLRLAGVRACLVFLLAAGAGTAAAQTRVAVFNFQMKSDTPGWVWLEKFLADQITTDLCGRKGVEAIARDRMQELAQRIHWAPELTLRDAKAVEAIRGQLQIEYVVTGLFVVDKDRLELTGQIVQVPGRKEAFRTSVSGTAADAIALQKRLSSELIAWLTNGSPPRVLSELPVWTRSLPAVRVLYEGVDLYDQGRYAEAWLKFRQASRHDEAYAEARYWVGKMYYFMDRYEHARGALEQFVYLNAPHPRVGDALVEYMHTFEQRGASPDDLLELYLSVRKRFPGVVLPSDKFDTLAERAAFLMERTDRPARALEFLWKDHQVDYEGAVSFVGRGGLPQGSHIRRCRLAQDTLLGYGQPGEPGVGDPIDRDEEMPSPSKRDEESGGCEGYSVKSREWQYLLKAPKGRCFDTIRVFPRSGLTRGKITVLISKDDWGDAGARTVDLPQALREGVAFDNLPRCRELFICCRIEPDTETDSDAGFYRGMSARVRYVRPGPSGRLDVACASTSYFRVEVDGRLGRSFPGVVGPLPPGEYTLRFLPSDPQGPYEPWQTRVVVERGRTTKVVGQLDWRKDSPWRAWSTGQLLTGRWNPTNYVSTVTRLDMDVDDHAVRVLWSGHGDIWSAVSTDGKPFGPAKPIVLPISSGWDEFLARYVRHPDGRHLLLFYSTRTARHEAALHLSWSRDFEHWSAPVRLDGDALHKPVDLFVDGQGRIVLVGLVGYNNEFCAVFHASRDMLRWEEIGRAPLGRRAQTWYLGRPVFREDGRYEFLAAAVDYYDRQEDSPFEPTPHAWSVTRYVGDRLDRWGPPELVGAFETHQEVTSLRACRRNGRTVAVVSGPNDSWAWLLREKAPGCWQRCQPQAPFTAFGAFGNLALACHPTRGDFIAWLDDGGHYPVGRLDVPARSGPYLIHGPGLDALPFQDLPKPPPGQETEPPPGVMEVRPERNAHAWVPELKALSGQGLAPGSVNVDGRPARAMVARFESRGVTFHAAAVWGNPNLQHPDRVCIDLSGTGRFAAPLTALRTRLGCGPADAKGPASLYCRYHTWRLAVDEGRAVECDAEYKEAGSKKTLGLRILSLAEGTFKAGNQLFWVQVADRHSNLRFNDPMPPGARRQEYSQADRVRLVPLPAVNLDEEMKFDAGSLLAVDGALHNLTIAPDGRAVSATPYAGPTVPVQTGCPWWMARFEGKNGTVVAYGSEKPCPLPPGQYKLTSLTGRYPIPDGGPRRFLRFALPGPRGDPIDLTVPENGKAALRVGPPFAAVIDAGSFLGRMAFSLSLKDVSGTPVSVTFSGPPDDAPVAALLVRDARGALVGTVPIVALHHVEWFPPEGLTGPLTATLQWNIPAFPVKAPPLSFSVK